MSSTTVHLGPLAAGIVCGLVGAVALLIGQGVYRNTQISDDVSMRARPVDPEKPTKREKTDDEIGRLVGGGFVVGGGVFILIGLVDLIVVLVRAISHAA